MGLIDFCSLAGVWVRMTKTMRKTLSKHMSKMMSKTVSNTMIKTASKHENGYSGFHGKVSVHLGGRGGSDMLLCFISILGGPGGRSGYTQVISKL